MFFQHLNLNRWDDDAELGLLRTKSKPLNKAKTLKKKTFRERLANERQSTNVIDLRAFKSIPIIGTLKWKTSFHLSSSVPSEIMQSLLRRGFRVSRVSVILKTWLTSLYEFQIWLLVPKQFSQTQVEESVINALQDVAAPNSIYISDG